MDGGQLVRRLKGVSWSDQTWNPFYGCLKVSKGCQFCYMYRDLGGRYGGNPSVVTRSKTTFGAPLTWKAPQLVFTCSWSDFFIEQADEWRLDAWEVIRRRPQHTYLILTKRPERIADHLPQGWPWPWVWLGVSVETPAYLWRADQLRAIPAAHRFVSLEPLLADLGTINLDGISWVIVGGESGPQHRPMAIAWVESIVDQCARAQVPAFVKQASALRDGQQGQLSDALWAHDWTPTDPWPRELDARLSA
jgi:protein gp37